MATPLTDNPDRALTVREVAEMLSLSHQTVERLFEKQRGVILIERPAAMHKRRYRTIRIPRYVYDRFIKERSV